MEMAGRLPKETAVYALLDNLGIQWTGTDHEAAVDMEGCQAA